MPVISKAIHVGTENVIDPETVTVHHGGHVIFFNHGTCKVRIDVPNDIFGDIPDLDLDPGKDTGPIEVSLQAPTGDTEYKVYWNCPNETGVFGDGYGDGAKTGHIKVDD